MTKRRRPAGWLAIAVVTLVLGCSAVTASAEMFTNDFGPLVPGYVPNDDFTFAAVPLPFSINYFGTTYSSIFVNNNGNATFGAGTGVFSPSPLNSQTTQPMIAPYWTDLDSRSDPLGAIVAGTGGSGVYFRQVSPTEVVMTWDRLGYFSVNYSGRAQFQLVLRDPTSAIPADEGVIGFFYDGVTSGTDGHNVTVGFGDGLAAINPGEISLFTGPSSTVSGQVNDEHFWFGLTGTGTPVIPPPSPNQVPEPGSIALLGSGLIALGFLRHKFKK
jgi:nidogen-like/PEP-CTERM motif-containing protein